MCAASCPAAVSCSPSPWRLHAVLSLSLMCFRRHHAGGLAAGQESPGHVHHRCQVTLSDASVWLLVEPRQLLPLLCLSGYS